MFYIAYLLAAVQAAKVDPNTSHVEWRGLKNIHIPVNYFYIYVKDEFNQPIIDGNVTIDFKQNGADANHIGYKQLLNRHDGSYIFRFRVNRPMFKLQISVLNKDGNHLSNSPRFIERLNNQDCSCPLPIEEFYDEARPTMDYNQINLDFAHIASINVVENNKMVQERFCKHPGATSLCRYIIKNNEIYRKCFGDHVGFTMFSDDILLQLARTVKIPDVEFWMNLGDWPMQKRKSSDQHAVVISWCGHMGYTDIVVPTYDLIESTNHMMTKVVKDQFSVQEKGRTIHWNDKIEKALFRGRDSSKERLKLAEMSQQYPDLIDAGITAYFFFDEEEEKYGKLKKTIPFFNFFDHKYQINMDGTVAAYRFPYLLLGNSLVLKQKSDYYEHFYSLLNNKEPHYLEVDKQLDNLLQLLKFAQEHNDTTYEMVTNSNIVVDNALQPINVYAYWITVLKTYAAKIDGITSTEGMHWIQQPLPRFKCDCYHAKHEEL